MLKLEVPEVYQVNKILELGEATNVYRVCVCRFKFAAYNYRLGRFYRFLCFIYIFKNGFFKEIKKTFWQKIVSCLKV